jgi:hypothetical protein
MRPSPLIAIAGLLLLPHHPHDVIDCVELSPQYASDHTLFCTSDGTLNVVGRSRNGGFSWRDVRSGMTAKHVYAMALAEDFETSGRAWAALGGDGFGLTTDRGETWTTINTPQNPMQLAVLPFRGDEPTLFFFGTGQWGEQKGLFRASRPGADDLALDPGRFDEKKLPTAIGLGISTEQVHVFVATSDQLLHRSVDAGTTWTTLPTKGDVRRIVCSPGYAQDRTLWIATFGSGVLVSRDGGATFSPANQGLADLDVNDVAVPRRWPQCQELFAATREHGVFRSKDGGARWELTSLQVEKTYQTDNHYRYVRLPADYPATPAIYVGTFEGLHFSLDDGANWIKSNMNPTRIGRRILLSPEYERDKTVFTSGYGMLLSTSSDAGSTWTFGATGVRALSSYALSIAPTWKDEGLMFLGIADGYWRSTDRGTTWKKTMLAPFVKPEGGRQDHDITQVVFSPEFAKDRVCYAISFGGVYASSDAGETFRCMKSPVEYSVEIALSPDFPRDHVLFVGGSRLARSTDGGETFGGDVVNFPVSGVVCAPDWTTSGEAFLWSGWADFHRSTDRGATWQWSSEGLHGHRSTCVRLSPEFTKNGTMYMTTFGGGMYRSTDRGRNWERYGSRDPRLDHITTFALSPAFERDHTMFLGGFEGIWRSTDAGETFELVTSRELYDQAREPWRHSERWTRPDRRGAHGGTVDIARHAGATASLPFVGSGVRILGTRGPDHGRAEILLDDKLVTVVDAYSEKAEDSATLYEDWTLPWGYHLVTVRALGQKRDAASDTIVGVDAAEVACARPAGDDGPAPLYSNR